MDLTVVKKLLLITSGHKPVLSYVGNGSVFVPVKTIVSSTTVQKHVDFVKEIAARQATPETK